MMLSQRNQFYKDFSKEADYIYYDLKISNIYDTAAPNETPEIFTVRDDTSGVLPKQSDYQIAISSFSLNVRLPLFIFPIQEGISNTDRDLSSFGMCGTYLGVDYTFQLKYIPDYDTSGTFAGISTTVPVPPSQNQGIQDNSTDYYYVFSFSNFVAMLNNALTNGSGTGIFDQILTAHPALITEYPFFQYDSILERIVLVVPTAVIKAGIELYLNELLIQYVGGFRTFHYGYNQTNFKDFKFIWNLTYAYEAWDPVDSTPPALTQGAIYPPSATTEIDKYKYLRYVPEYDTRYRLNDIVGLLITSNYIRVRPEFYPKIGNPNSSTVNGRSGTDFNTAQLSILSAFDLIDSEGQVSWRQVQHYQPFQKKWIDLVSNEPLVKIDCNVFLETKRGQIIPAYIPVETQSNIKLVFRRKGVTE